ncbi:MAG TPA: trehalose-6-phosphate synthase [Gemmatimonadaceae bacterium]|nr:trehalose-6-phosphate synthase [Gemmatimonadaceae bacterium]
MTDVSRYLDGRTLILLSNREPYEHLAGDAGIHVRQPPGGLVSALDPTMRRTSGTWVAWGSGSADRETADENGRLGVPPFEPAYTLRRVWLTDEDIEGYYLGFANTALWPLCHLLIQHFEFHREHWEHYQAVNERFAAAVHEESLRVTGTAQVWVQDYHFALVPAELRRRARNIFIHHFWHIPFPPPDILRLLPTGVPEALLGGLLGNDLIEFHTERYARNFLDCVRAFLPDADVRGESLRVGFDGRQVLLGVFPISIDVDRFEQLALSEESDARATALRQRYARGGRALGISVDRIDYTKGIPERLRALDRLWTDSPELRGRFTMIIVATPSRSELPAYQNLEAEVLGGVRDINERFGTTDWDPIVLVHENVHIELLAAVYRAADLCLVSSLQDGMNLVAKEFVASQVDEHGVLVLSRFTGAAEEIEEAVLINPFNVGGFADGIRTALEMEPDERRRRMRAMRSKLHRSTIFDWLQAILARCAELMDGREVDWGDRDQSPLGGEAAPRPTGNGRVPNSTSTPEVGEARS